VSAAPAAAGKKSFTPSASRQRRGPYLRQFTTLEDTMYKIFKRALVSFTTPDPIAAPEVSAIAWASFGL